MSRYELVGRIEDAESLLHDCNNDFFIGGYAQDGHVHLAVSGKERAKEVREMVTRWRKEDLAELGRDT